MSASDTRQPMHGTNPGGKAPKPRVVVLGGGSFGTVVANIIAGNGAAVTLWLRDPVQAKQIQSTGFNERYLPGYKLHQNLQISNDLEHSIANADMVVFSIPSRAFRGLLEQVNAFMTSNQYLITTTKGIDPEEFLLMSQLLERYFPDNPIGVISGPNLAKEIAAQYPAATVIASEHGKLRVQVQELLKSQHFQVYTSKDRYGVELGGALKNIYAIAAGICAALNLGENTRGMLITASLAEMSRLAATMGANQITFLGLSGVGDLIVTCSSPLSRNYRIGYALGEGKSMEQALASLDAVAEGVNSLALIKQYADKLDVSMPLVRALYHFIYEGTDLPTLIAALMQHKHDEDVQFFISPELD